MRSLTYPLLLILCFNFVFAYPVVITEGELNHSKYVQIIKSIDPEILKEVQVIEFHNHSYKNYEGYAWAEWNWKHDCTYSKIDMYLMPEHRFEYVLYHEIGHIYDMCILKSDDPTEEYAETFAMERMK